MYKQFYDKKLNLTVLTIIFVFFKIIFANMGFSYQIEQNRADANELRLLYELDRTELEKRLNLLSETEALERGVLLGSIAMATKNLTKGEEYYTLALRYAKKGNLPREQVLALVSLAKVEAMQDKEDRTLKHLLEAKEIVDSGAITDKKLRILLLVEIGESYTRLGMYKDSQVIYEQASVIANDIKDELMLVKCKMGLGYSYMKQGVKIDDTKLLFESAAEFYQKNNMISDAAEALKCLGNLEISSSDAAKEMYLKALELYNKIGDVHGQGNCKFNLGLVNMNKKKYTEALEYFKDAMYLYARAGSTTGIGIAQLKIGETYIWMGELGEARSSLEQAAFMLEKAQSWDRLGETEVAFGDLFAAMKNNNKAKAYYQKAIIRFNNLKLVDKVYNIQKKLDKCAR